MVPSAFKQYNQFVVAELGTKKPINVNDPSKGVDHLNPANWLTAEQAIQWVNDNGSNDYCVGFVFTKEDPFFFLDIDKAYDGTSWSPIAIDICERLNDCYIEVSQSGTGLHIFGRGTPPEDHANKNIQLGLELYTHGRYVALTGFNARGDANTYVNGRLDETVAEYFTRATGGGGTFEGWTTEPVEGYGGPEDDDELIELMLNSKTPTRVGAGLEIVEGIAFRDLWEANAAVLGNFFPHDTNPFDASSADLSLASKLAFWTGNNCARIERLMRRSGLVRDKWNRPDYLRQRVIPTAVGSCTECYQGKADTTSLIDKIEQEATTPEAIKALAVEIGEAKLDRISREAARSRLQEVAKLAGYDITKAAIKQASSSGVDTSGVGFIDVNASGKPRPTDSNFRALLNHYGITIRYNMISKEKEITIPGINAIQDNYNNVMLTHLENLAIFHDITGPREFVRRGVTIEQERNIYNPVANWVLSKPWDGVTRLPELVNTLGSVPSPLTVLMIRRWLIAGIEAAFNPRGLSGGSVLVLQGPQGAGKTRWLSRLFDNRTDWFNDGMILDPTRSDSVRQAVRYWCTELGEIDGTFKKSEIEALKAFITSDTDEYRLPYALDMSKYSRRTVFAGTVNPDQYLNDPTGNRRFWTIPVGDEIDYDHNIDVQQIWAEAYTWYQAGERHWLDRAEQLQLADHNIEYTNQTTWYSLMVDKWDLEAPERRVMTCTDIFDELAPGRHPKPIDLRQIADAVRRLTGVNKGRKSGGKLVYDVPLLIKRF